MLTRRSRESGRDENGGFDSDGLPGSSALGVSRFHERVDPNAGGMAIEREVEARVREAVADDLRPAEHRPASNDRCVRVDGLVTTAGVLPLAACRCPDRVGARR